MRNLIVSQRSRVVSIAKAILLAFAAAAFAACAAAGQAPPRAPLPTAVSCADAAQLKQRALDDRRLSADRKSDQESISLGSRANFFASLATIASLTCKVTLANVDDELKPALEAARRAEDTRGWYESISRWSEADFAATQVIAVLIDRVRPL